MIATVACIMVEFFNLGWPTSRVPVVDRRLRRCDMHDAFYGTNLYII
jgi:hypothetical protein